MRHEKHGVKGRPLILQRGCFVPIHHGITDFPLGCAKSEQKSYLRDKKVINGFREKMNRRKSTPMAIDSGNPH